MQKQRRQRIDSDALSEMYEGGNDYEYIRGIDIAAGDFHRIDIQREPSEIVFLIPYKR